MTDTVTTAPATDTVQAAPATDTVQAAPATDTVQAAPATDTVQAAAGDDVYELKAPDGTEFDPAAIEKLVEFSKANGIKPAQAQELANMAAGVVQAQLEASAQAWRDAQQVWVEQAKKDAEIGGPKFADNLRVIDTALTKLGTPELSAFLKETGIGANVELARFFYRVGKALSEDSFKFGGNAPAGADLPPELVLFPSMRPAN